MKSLPPSALLFVAPLVALTVATGCRPGEPPPPVSVDAAVPAPEPAPALPPVYREIVWEDLIPEDWDPMRTLKGMDFSKLEDNDPRAAQAMAKLKADWDKAPVEPTLDGKQVRLAGFAVPLERKGDAVTELLLVPYFGACIHVPPPPANQVVHVLLKTPAKGLMTMDALWVSGTIRLQRGDSGGLGIYGYRLEDGEAMFTPTSPP